MIAEYLKLILSGKEYLIELIKLQIFTNNTALTTSSAKRYTENLGCFKVARS